MKKEREDAQKTKQDLADAMILLLLKKPLQQIRIADITKRAGYSRQTFYQHFADKESVVNYYLDSLFDHLFDQIKKEHLTDYQLILYRFCLLWQKNQNYIRACVNSKLTWLLFEKYFDYTRTIFTYLHQATGLAMPTNNELQYIAGGQAKAQINWVLHQSNQDAKQFAALSIRFIRAALSFDNQYN